MTLARWPNTRDDDPLTPEGSVCDQSSCSMSQIRTLSGFPDTWTSSSLEGASAWVMAQSKWRAWNSDVSGYDPINETVRVNEITSSWYSERMNPGNPVPHNYGVSYFILSGSRALLDTIGEWWYDAVNEKVLVMPPADFVPGQPGTNIEAKSRDYGFILDKLSHIQVHGINFRATSISMKESKHCLLKDLHFYEFDYQWGYNNNMWDRADGIIVSGEGNVIRDCEFTRCCDAGVTLLGRNNSLVNCYLHEVDYAGFDGGPINLGGHGHLVSHNTVERTSRKGINPGGLAQLIQYNHIREVGLVNRDQAAVFAGGFDAGNTVIRNNWINVSNGNIESIASGIYMDNWHQNAIVHHNIVWNTEKGLIVNRPGNYDMWVHNTVQGTIRTSYGPWIGMESLHGTSIHNNWATGEIDKNNYSWSKMSNLVTGNEQLNLSFDSGIPVPNSKPGGEDAGTILQELNEGFTGEKPDIGAVENGKLNWSAGHDFENPPDPVYEPASFYYRNYVVNGSFDFNRVNISPKFDLYYMWNKTGFQNSSVEYHSGFNFPAADQRFSIYANSLHLKGTSDDGAEQHIDQLPIGNFIFSAYVRLADPLPSGADVYLSVNKGKREIAGTWASSVKLTGDQKWRMVKVRFPNTYEGDYTVRISKVGDGEAYIDNIGLLPEYAEDPFTLVIDTNNIVFQVRDASTQEAIPGCILTFDQVKYEADENGMLLLEDILSGSHSLLVENEAYNDLYIEDMEIFSDSTIIINLGVEKITVMMRVTDCSSSQPVSRARVFIDHDLTSYTSKDGLASFESQTGALISFAVDHEDYFTYQDTVMIIRDTLLKVPLTKRLADIRFIIRDESGSPLQNANVSIGNMSISTNLSGDALFMRQPSRMEYIYTVDKTDYMRQTESFYLERDTTMEVWLSRLTAFDQENKRSLNVFPNPTDEKLYLAFDGNKALVSMIGTDGIIQFKKEIESGISQEDICEIEPGIYILRFTTDGYSVTQKVIIY